MKWVLFSLMVVGAFAQAEQRSDFVEDKPVSRIVFGACNDPRRASKPFYDVILQRDPDVFVFLGDNIYGDTTDMAVLRKKYEELRAQKGYKELVENTRVLATWDDHDFGVNDGGNSYSHREESEDIFLDFFEEPEESVRRERPGVYASYSFGAAPERVRIIVLDTRYFRDELPKAKKKPAPGMMGWYEPTEDTSKTLAREGSGMNVGVMGEPSIESLN
jgi:alkaline phosphatase D